MLDHQSPAIDIHECHHCSHCDLLCNTDSSLGKMEIMQELISAGTGGRSQFLKYDQML